jgi:hypothetical protein
MLMRFWNKVKFTDTCWLWERGRQNVNASGHGYGRFQTGRRVMQAHRVAWELIHAEQIPDHLVIDHLCRIPACVNPDHMEVVTQVVNARRQIKIPITHCRRGGHEFTEANTYVIPSTGYRLCRACKEDHR